MNRILTERNITSQALKRRIYDFEDPCRNRRLKSRVESG
jgi:hypothetical protein